MSSDVPVFTPRPGQVDFTNIRWAPVINCLLQYQNKILLVQRNPKMHFYPGTWNGISGFLDDDRSLEQKVKDELHEELGLSESSIVSIHPGPVFDQDAPDYKKTWIVHPVLVNVNTDKITLDWEAKEFRWLTPEEARTFPLLPGFLQVLDALFPVSR